MIWYLQLQVATLPPKYMQIEMNNIEHLLDRFVFYFSRDMFTVEYKLKACFHNKARSWGGSVKEVRTPPPKLAHKRIVYVLTQVLEFYWP